MKTPPPLSRREFLLAAGATAAAGAAPPPKSVVIDCHTPAGTGTALTAPWTTLADPREILRRNRQAGID